MNLAYKQFSSGKSPLPIALMTFAGKHCSTARVIAKMKNVQMNITYAYDLTAFRDFKSNFALENIKVGRDVRSSNSVA